MRARTIKETLNEFGGAGYAVYGGAANYGNPGRGIGFGQSSQNKGGPNLMYTYDVKDLNQALQPPPTPQDEEKYVHAGSEVKIKSLETGKWFEGTIISSKTDSDGNILHYEVLNPTTGQSEKGDPSSVEVINNDMEPGLATLDRDIVGESLVFESVDFFLNEKKNPRMAVKRSKLPKEIKEKVLKLGVSKFEDGKAHGVGKPKVEGKSFDGVGLGADKNGFFVYTHRARSKSKPDPSKIPDKDIKFIKSTG